MLVVETIGRMRREYSVQGKSIKEITRELRLSRNTVRKAFDLMRPHFPTSARCGGRPCSRLAIGDELVDAGTPVARLVIPAPFEADSLAIPESAMF